MSSEVEIHANVAAAEAPKPVSLLIRGMTELCACFCFQVLGSLSPTPWCNAVTLAILVLATARISGGHLNPCVTYIFFMLGYTFPIEAVVYVIAQYIGCVLGSLYLPLMLPGLSVGGDGMGCFHPTVSSARVVACEALGTFVFMVCVFATVWYTQSKHGYGTIGPIMIGLSLLAPAFAIGPMTGAALNPARLLASPTVFKDSHPGDCDCGMHMGAYVGGEMLGATFALVCIFWCFGIAESSWYGPGLRSFLNKILNSTRHKPFISNSVVTSKKTNV